MASIPDVADLTIAERIGQVMGCGWQGDAPETMNAHARALLEDLRVGAVVLFARNVAAPEVTRETIRQMQAASDVPLLVGVDQEGGTVCRFGEPLHQFPGAMALGANPGDAGLWGAEKQAAVQASELQAVGVNWNLAPCLDVNNNPDNPIIGVRSFGEDPQRVGDIGAEMIEGYQLGGLLACAKHFPGHGDTSIDSHLGLPTIAADRKRLDEVELVPFRAAIQAGVGSIMTTHIVFPALDPDRPATLSKHILTGLLRAQLGFKGLIVTDCLEMQGVAGPYGTPKAAVEALKAGGDLVLISHNLETQRLTHAAIHEAVLSGDLPEWRLTDAAEHVLAAKKRIAAGEGDGGGEPWTDPAHDAAERQVALDSVTVVRNAGAIPIRPAPGSTVWVVSALDIGAVIGPEIEARLPKVRLATRLDPAFPDGMVEAALADRREGDRVVFVTTSRDPWSNGKIDLDRQAEAVRRMHALDPKLVVVAAREPYDIRRFAEVGTYVCTYGAKPCSLRALVAVLFGEHQPIGRLPVTIPGIA